MKIHVMTLSNTLMKTSKAYLISVSLLALLTVSALPALAQAPEAIRQYNDGIAAYTQGRSSDALKKFSAATRIDPSYGDAYYNMGSIYYQMKQYEPARDNFQKAVNLSPADGQAKYNLGLSLEKLSRYDEAINILSQIPASDSKYASAKAKADELRLALKPKAAPAQQTGPQPVRQPGAAAAAATATATPSKLMLQTFSKGYDGPTGIAIGPGGFMYVANYSKNQIYKVGANGDKAIFAQGEQIKGPIGLVYNPKLNELYTANYLLGNITRISAAGKTGVLVSGLNKPYNLYLDAVNNVLYVSEQESNTISRIVLP